VFSLFEEIVQAWPYSFDFEWSSAQLAIGSPAQLLSRLGVVLMLFSFVVSARLLLLTSSGIAVSARL